MLANCQISILSPQEKEFIRQSFFGGREEILVNILPMFLLEDFISHLPILQVNKVTGRFSTRKPTPTNLVASLQKKGA